MGSRDGTGARCRGGRSSDAHRRCATPDRNPVRAGGAAEPVFRHPYISGTRAPPLGEAGRKNASSGYPAAHPVEKPVGAIHVRDAELPIDKEELGATAGWDSVFQSG